jgi:hypothetical protein
MKSKYFLIGLFLTVTSICQAQLGGVKMPSKPTASTVQEPTQTAIDSTKTPEALLDKAVLANDKGDKAATVAKGNTGSLKDKLLGQVSTLKNLIPLAESGMLGSGILPKAAGVAKLLMAHQRIEGIIGGASMLSNVGALTSNLGMLKTGMSLLSPASQSSGGSLISTAMSGLGKLSQGGPAASALAPTVKGQLGSVLDMVKGGL